MVRAAPESGAAVLRPEFETETRARPLRVAFCLDNMGPGGTEQNAVRTAEELVMRGLAVPTMFSLNADGPMRARYEAAGVPVHAVPVPSLVGVATARQILAFSHRLREGRFDVVHSHDLYSNVIATCAARLASVPVVIASKRWIHWRRSHQLLNRGAYRLAHCALANSGEVARTLREEEGVPAGRVAVVPNFVEESAFARWSDGERASRLAAFGVPAGACVVGVVARLRREKRHDLLLQAVARLRTRFPDVFVLLIGDGPERDAVGAEAAALGLADRVMFTDHLPNRPNPHQLLDVSVLCSAYEGFPNTLVEAMAAARPVVATRVGGVPDAVRDGETGLLVAPGDADALADALAGVLADPARARVMGAAGERHARARFHADTVLPQLIGLYDALLARAGARVAA